MAEQAEMKDLNPEAEEPLDEQGEEETNLGGTPDDAGGDDELLDDDDDDEEQRQLERMESLRDPNASIIVPQGFNPNIEEDTVRELEQKKDFLREYLSISVDEADGTNSATFLKNIELRVGKTGKIIGINWKGKKVIVSVKDGYDYTGDKDLKSAVDDFKAVLGRAQIEHDKTAAAKVEKQLADAGVANATREDVEQVLRSVEVQTEDRLEEKKEEVLEVRKGRLTRKELDSLIGDLAFDRTQEGPTGEDHIMFLTDAEIPHWKKKLAEAKEKDANSDRSKQLEGIVEVLELKADLLRIRNNSKVESSFAKGVLKEEVKTGDISRLRRFANWAKENLAGISAVAISVAGIITTIRVAGRGAVRAGAGAVGSFAKGLAKVAKALGPVVGAVIGLVSKVLCIGAKGLEWVSRNLWSLALLIAYVVYEQVYKKKYKNKHK